MKKSISINIAVMMAAVYKRVFVKLSFLLIAFLLPFTAILAQDEEETTDKPVRAVFESALLIDNQTVVVPIKGTFEFDIQHRFGTLKNGFEDLFGLYANSNIRIGLWYSPVDNLAVGFGFAKYKNLLDFNAKYSLLKQTRSGSIPVSVTYYGNITIDPREEDRRGDVFHYTDRYSYFHQLIIARKFTDWFSLQVAPSISHYNVIDKNMKNDHIAVAIGGQFKVTGGTSIIANIDQPITQHTLYNPNPNLSLGVQFTSSSHAFQIFLGNYSTLNPQENNFFNNRNYADGFGESFLIGFNITRLWNF